MAEHARISLHLSRVLDEIGLNELTVEKRKEAFLFVEHADSLFSELFDNYSTHLFGSQSEGSTTPGLVSDVDFLFCHQHFKIIQDLTEWTQGQPNLLMLRESTAPGYCRLQLIKRDIPEPEMTLSFHDCAYDEFKRVLLKNSAFDTCYPDFTYLQGNQHGPAQTWYMSALADIDITNGFMCTSKLNAVQQWATRNRPRDWPSASLIKQVVDEPVYIVPVGYKLSSTQSIEWRISTSLAERCLMFSLNIVQIKCYVILKILMKTYVTPVLGKSITSYHCKTALLYCMESSDADFWQEDNLLQCITRCLEMLLDWTMDEFCPHFILAEVNLFAGKVTSDNKEKLKHGFNWLIQFNEMSILAPTMDGLGQRLWMKLGNIPNRSSILDSKETLTLLGFLEFFRQGTSVEVCIYMASSDQDVASSIILKAKTMLESRTNLDKLQQEATRQVLVILNGLLGSFIASASLGRRAKIPQEAIKLLDASATSDIASLIKQASVFYCSGEIEKVKQLCEKVDSHFECNIIFPVCQCYPHIPKYSNEQLQTMYTRKNEVRYAHCVKFTYHEIHCVPQALRHELFRGVDNDIQNRQNFDGWMVLAVMDCLPFLYYLQYMTYSELGKENHRKQSLRNLERCISLNKQLLCHVETAWNILGQCYEMEKQPVAALHCYRKSLDIRPRNNAANWISFYRCTQGR